ncbi:DUF6245 family protein [Nonomuraea sp. NPDC049750]|uniref:DUF6245 family protein n=1 Tax=Nonomuraea sp. NPDC049750 TaxID=3154738 RepID=UPI003400BA97
MPPSPPPAPSASSISAALAALGASAQTPTDAELAAAVGGERVLAAVLANSLYGAAIGVGMLTEGHMLAHGAGWRRWRWPAVRC